MHIRDSSGIYGAERVILALGRNINKEKFNFLLLCMRREDVRNEELIAAAEENGIKVISVDVSRKIDLNAITKIRNIFRENSVSIFHSHDFKSDIYGVLASMNLGIKRVTTAHGSTRDSMKIRTYLLLDEKIFYRFFDKIIAVSNDIFMQFSEEKRLRPKIELIQNGVDPLLLLDNANDKDLDKKFDFPKNCKIFGVAGRLFPDKGQQIFLEAFSRAHKINPSIAALIVGDGPEKNEIERRIQELKLEDRVFLYGFQKDMKNVYDSIDYLVIPSVREGLPYVLLEAMARKVPVIATAVGDIPLLVEDGVTGYLVSPKDPKALRERMLDLLSNHNKSKDMAERAYQLVIEKFSADRMVQKTENLYSSLVA